MLLESVRLSNQLMVKIENLVISGGGPNGLLAYGAIQQLQKENIWDKESIKNIYASSFGAIISVMITLDYSWNDLNDYIIKRPWEKIVQLDLKDYINAISACGLITDGFCNKALTPLLEAKDLSKDITLSEYCQHTGVNLHFFTVNINGSPLDIVEMNSQTYPNLTLLKAIEMTTAVPILFPPVFHEGKCFIDGGILLNYPTEIALQNPEVNKSNTLGVFMRFINDQICMEQNDSIFDLLAHIFKRMIKHIALQKPSHGLLEMEVCCTVDGKGGFSLWENILKNSDTRAFLIEQGKLCAKPLIENIISQSSSEET